MPAFPKGVTEAFLLKRAGNDWLVAGSDPSGVLYGCLEMARRIEAGRHMPAQLDSADRPAFKIRGTNLFWMKQGHYDWAVTAENFPWFFDRTLMLRYLDELVDNRYNTIYFWNGHPFIYFLRLPKYPEACVLSDADLDRHMDQLQWFTKEAEPARDLDRTARLQHPRFAGFRQGPRTRGRALGESRIHAAARIVQAPLRERVCEKLPQRRTHADGGRGALIKAEEFVRDAIIGGIKESGKNPPLIVRQWTIDAYRFRDIIEPNYDNLFTMMKHNTEMIVSPYPDRRNATSISFGQNHDSPEHRKRLQHELPPYCGQSGSHAQRHPAFGSLGGCWGLPGQAAR